jgi:hypothetical protein
VWVPWEGWKSAFLQREREEERVNIRKKEEEKKIGKRRK